MDGAGEVEGFTERFGNKTEKGWIDMIRFCDKEACCVLERELNRQQMLIYFMNDHREDSVCVLDDDGKYCGHITYEGLLKNENVQDAVIRTKVVLDDGVWEGAREYFAVRRTEMGIEWELLPVVDKNQNLIGFAYEDLDADRELRMLRELQEKKGALQFADIYPDFQCVEINEFNELAYFFARYLSAQGILVRVRGDMWNGFIESEEAQILDYKRMQIYAEGIWQKTENWLENLLRSVSVEFECIDHIYEANIKSGIIKNADGSSEELICCLKDSDQIVILGTDNAAQDAYDYFRKMEINVCCFAEEILDKAGHLLFGKPIFLLAEAIEKYRQAVFVDVHEKGSAWGMGKTDYFDCLGYKRNQKFFLLRDYMEVPKNGLKNALSGQKIVLTGDILLCEKVADYLEKNQIVVPDETRYFSFPWEEGGNQEISIKKADAGELDADAVYLLVFPEYVSKDLREKSEEKQKRAISWLKAHGIFNYTNYFVYMDAFIYMEKDVEKKYRSDFLSCKKIVLGSHNSYSGNIFIRGLLDDHPEIMIMTGYHYLSNELFWLCVSFSIRNGEEIPALFLQWYRMNWKEDQLENADKFMERLCQLLKNKERVTSQELFVIFHEAYLYMYGREAAGGSDMLIYWEPHYFRRDLVEYCVEWLGAKEVACDIIHVVRNMFMRNGSNVKSIINIKDHPLKGFICYAATGERMDRVEKKEYPNSKRIVVRFEDIKCRPREELGKLCQEWDLTWSESLMHTSFHGETWAYGNGEKEIKDFDLSPVYHTYDEYFSESDRLKIALISMPWQKKYGYPYVDVSVFSRRELQEIFLKEFRFMKRVPFRDERKKTLHFVEFQEYVRKKLQRVRMLTAKEERD